MEVANYYEWHVCFVTSFDHHSQTLIPGEWVYVDPGHDSVDLFIINRIRKNMCLITHDIGLASLALAEGAYVISPRGKLYEKDTIDTSLFFRYLHAKERRRGNYGKGPKPFTLEDRNEFKKSLHKLLSNIEGFL